MKRRTFIQGLTAIVTAPVLPLKALATTAPAAATFEQPYLWASFISRVHNKSSPAMLQRLLKLDAETARHVYSELLANKVITPPNAMGLSQATSPYPQATMLNSPPTQAAQPPTSQNKPIGENQPKKTLQAEKNAPSNPSDSSSINQEMAASEDDAEIKANADGFKPPELQADKRRQDKPDKIDPIPPRWPCDVSSID